MATETKPSDESPQSRLKNLLQMHRTLRLQPDSQAQLLRQIRQAYLKGQNVEQPPFYSIVVPAYNEANLLPQLLHALTAQWTDRPYEIILIANNCTDQTAQIGRACGVQTLEYTNPLYGVAYARQVGLEQAKGAIIATTDADAVMAPTWLMTLCQPLLQNSNLAVVTGQVHHYAELADEMVTYLKLYDTLQNAIRRVKCATGYTRRVTIGTNMAVRRDQALNVGGYQPRRIIGEDFSIGDALSHYGAVRFMAAAAATVYSSQRRFQGKSFGGVLLHDIVGVDRLYGTATDYQMQNIR